MRDVADFNSTVMLIPSFQLSDCSESVTVLCPVICLTYVSFKYACSSKSGHFCRLFSVQLVHAGWLSEKTILHFLQPGDNTTLKTRSDILVNVASFDQRIYCKRVYFRRHCTLQDTTRSHDLIIEGFADIIIPDNTAGQKNQCFTESKPRTTCPLYGFAITTNLIWGQDIIHNTEISILLYLTTVILFCIFSW